MVKSDRAWHRSDRALDRCRNSCFSSLHSLSYSSTVRWIQLGIELGIDLRSNNARRTVLARVSGLVILAIVKDECAIDKYQIIASLLYQNVGSERLRFERLTFCGIPLFVKNERKLLFYKYWNLQSIEIL